MTMPYLPHEIDAHPDTARIWATLEKYGVRRETHIVAEAIDEDDVDDAEDSIRDIENAADEARSSASDLAGVASELKALCRSLKARYLGKAA